MLTCLPQSICSWDFRILGAEAGHAAITLNRMSQQGTLTLGGSRYDIVKQGFLRSEWTLQSGAGVHGHASKAILSRHYELQTDGRSLTVAGRLMSSGYSLLVGGTEVGEIARVHAFTRRATIECARSVPELDQIFAFWFVALAWRIAASD